MAIVPMQKVAVLAHSSLTEEMLSLLQDASVIEIIEQDIEGEAVDHTKVAFEKAEVVFTKQFLLPYASKRILNAMQKHDDPKTIEKAALTVDFKIIIDRVKEIEEEKQQLSSMRKENDQKKKELLPWKYYPYTNDAMEGTKHTAVLLGTLPTTNIDAFKQKLQRELPKTALLPLAGENEKETGIVAHVWKHDQEKFNELATVQGWTDAQLSLAKGKTVEESLKEASMAMKEIDQRENVLDKELSALSKELPNLARLEIFIKWLDEKQNAREALLQSQETVTLIGWVPKKEIGHLEAKLEGLSKATALLKMKVGHDEVAPVLLHNRIWITPFQSVTNLYGLPLSSEMDPTASLSPFFILFFALCLTDAGYGAVIATVFGIAIWKLKLKINDQPLVWLLCLSGIVTFFVSIPFGGWFGITPDQVPVWLTYTNGAGEKLFLGQIWNLSTESGITFLQNLSLALGLTHLSYGMFLAGYHKWVHDKKVQALWMDFTNHALIGSALFYGFAPEEMSQFALYTLYAVLVIFVWGKGYGSKWFIRPIVGLIGLLNFSISMMSNTLSYLRLLALGLVTGAIALAINQVAIEIGNLFPIWLAIPVIITILLGGHLVSIALNTLGSFIHSGRLQFIEFFSQFFEGGGRAFSPYKRSITP